MRVAHLDMNDTNQHCPSGFRLITSPKSTCGTPGSIDVCPPHSTSMESSTPECVGRSLDISIILLMHLIHTIVIKVAQLTVNMLMVLASLMVKDQENIFGHLQLFLMKLGQISGSVHVPRPILPSREWSHHSYMIRLFL